MYTIKNAYQIIEESLKVFIYEEKNNILSTISERSLVGQLLLRIYNYINNKYPNHPYFVDIEYNRKQQGKLKTILSQKGHDEYQIISITCDLIVHSRGNLINDDNFIAIEMKKSDRSIEEKNKDRYRLMALTKSKSSDQVWSNEGLVHPEHVCGYLLGVYIEIDIKRKLVLLEFYEDGNFKKKLFHKL